MGHSLARIVYAHVCVLLETDARAPPNKTSVWRAEQVWGSDGVWRVGQVWGSDEVWRVGQVGFRSLSFRTPQCCRPVLLKTLPPHNARGNGLVWQSRVLRPPSPCHCPSSAVPEGVGQAGGGGPHTTPHAGLQQWCQCRRWWQ